MLMLGISPEQAKRFTCLMELWLRESGPEWTVERIKSLKPAMVHMLSTEEDYSVPLGWATRTNRKGRRIFKDPLLHEMFTQARRNSKVATNFLRLHQTIELLTLSEVQKEKMVRAVTLPPSVSLSGLLKASQAFKLNQINSDELETLQRIGSNSKTLIGMIGGSKRSPTFDIDPDSSEWIYRGSASREDARAFDFERFLCRDEAIHRLQADFQTEVSDRIIGSGLRPLPYVEGSWPVADECPAGTLVPLQEGGAKCRWIANPVLLLQALGEPLKDKLFAYSKMAYPQIYTGDQQAGHLKVNQWLREGKTVYCYDCTSFTDRFPLVLQELALRKLNRMGIASDFDLRAFDLVMRKSWHSPDLGQMVRWEVGQPLGYGPSFHLATLSHAMVLQNLGKGSCEDSWAVVGDDVVISDPQLAADYQEYMTVQAGVEINSSKSVISPKIGEFLGKLITVEGVIPSTKVKPLTQSDQVRQSLVFYGSEAYMFLDEKQRELVLSCYLPEHVGGLGFTPKSMSYKDYTAHLNVERIATLQIQRDWSRFHGREVLRADSQRKFVSLKSQIMTRNTEIIQLLGLAELRFHLGDEEIFINECTGLPTGFAPRDDVTNSALLRHDTFMHIQDKAWMLTQPKSSSDIRRVCVNRYGYIDYRELPSTLSGTTAMVSIDPDEGKSNDSQLHDSAKHLFRNWREFIKELYSEREEESAKEEGRKTIT